ncbi:specifically androgen-regulated gene protein [Danio aesculapii]|uniref:specifically androgen-regulated gene protein n=1 Tax=Danio aesculapii TaxID=1142201 RepID=UPI0024BF3A5F|nr:specifically androgen-regulated gene protein [Danio aesculapii]
MPKSDTWPGGISIESVSGMDSAGSCDSVHSVTSGFSDGSLEHLSAEEIACLMFLKETIESLEAEDDSGLSNDEPDCPSNGLKENTAHQTSISQNKSQEFSALEGQVKGIGKDGKPPQKYLVPTPLLLASGNGKIVKPVVKAPVEAPVGFIDAPDGFRSSPDHQQHGRIVLEDAPVKVAPSIGLLSDVVDLPPSFIPEPPVKTGLCNETKAKDGSSESLIVKPQLKVEKVSSEVPLEFIPPPSDFMDKPPDWPPPPIYDEPPEWIPELPNVEPHTSAESVKPTEVTKSQTVDPETSKVSLSHNDIENLRKKASFKKAPHLAPIMVAQHSSVDKPMTPSPSSEHIPALPKDYNDSKSPPAVAPKPKKLPSNIILKSHKDTGTTHSLLPQNERSQMDPQKIRMEALMKLGLLKNEEVETGPIGVSPSHSPTFKAKSHPQSPGYPTAPVETVQEPSRLSESPVDVQQPTEAIKHQDVKSREGSFKKQAVTSFQIKSASLDRAAIPPQTSNPDRTNVELSPGQLRRSRAGPSSLGSAKEFSISHLAEESHKLLHGAAVQHSNEPQKLPRHNGISVMISPNGKNGENRREALKKLGLLRD